MQLNERRTGLFVQAAANKNSENGESFLVSLSHLLADIAHRVREEIKLILHIEAIEQEMQVEIHTAQELSRQRWVLLGDAPNLESVRCNAGVPGSGIIRALCIYLATRRMLGTFGNNAPARPPLSRSFSRRAM